jgi:hypothetical protein
MLIADGDYFQMAGLRRYKCEVVAIWGGMPNAKV